MKIIKKKEKNIEKLIKTKQNLMTKKEKKAEKKIRKNIIKERNKTLKTHQNK